MWDMAASFRIYLSYSSPNYITHARDARFNNDRDLGSRQQFAYKYTSELKFSH